MKRICVEQLPKQTGKCTNSRAGKKTNFPGCLLSDISVWSRLLVASEEARDSPQGREGHLHRFSFPRSMTECRGGGGERQATALVPTWWPDEGFRVQLPPRSSAYASATGRARRWPLPVACLEDGWGHGAGPGAPPSSLQGPHHCAGRLGLHHSWHTTAESNGLERRWRVFL